MLDYQSFLKKIKRELEREYSDRAQVSLREVVKNNNIKMDSVTIVEEGSNISPMIYLNDYYHAYENGESFEQIMKSIRDCYQRYRVTTVIDTSVFEDFSRVKENILPHIVNRKKNAPRLNSVPAMDYLDLSVIYYYTVKDFEKGTGGVLITNGLLEDWQIECEELNRIAFANMKRTDPAEFCSMKEMLERMMGGSMLSDDDEQFPLYILSNKDKSFGAVWITDTDVLEEISRQIGSEYYVLPSSVHECIIVPVNDMAGRDEHMLRAIVRDVNETQVDPQEVLSDQIYRYDGKDKCLRLCSIPEVTSSS